MSGAVQPPNGTNPLKFYKQNVIKLCKSSHLVARRFAPDQRRLHRCVRRNVLIIELWNVEIVSEINDPRLSRSKISYEIRKRPEPRVESKRESLNRVTIQVLQIFP